MSTGVRWMSVGPGTGYGDASEAYLSGLRAAGVPVTWTPLGWPSRRWAVPHGPVDVADVEGAVHADIANIPIEHDTVVVCSFPLWHPSLSVEARGRRLFAYTTWETDRLPDEYVTLLNRYDRVIAPSRFNATVFEASGVTAPVLTVPHIARPVEIGAIDTERVPDAGFVVYTIATWTTRKALLDTAIR